MADELVDLLDSESGKVVGTIMKHEAHRIGAWHKSIHVYLINEKNELLLQLREKSKDLYPDVWDISCGGHVGAGEATQKTAQREVKEELGLKIKISDIKFLFTNKEVLKYGTFHSSEFVDVFVVRAKVNIKDVKIQESEVAGAKFVPLEKFFAMVASKEEKLFPHWEEYSKILPTLKKELQRDNPCENSQINRRK